MDVRNLTEIHKGEIGTGLLIECDGYISKDCGNNQQLFESYNKINEGIDNEFHCPYPFIVDAVFQKYDIENANGRIYPEHILKREVQKYLKIINEKRAIGECNHPESSTIDLSRVSHNIIELHWEGHTLVGKMEILVSEGFRKHGIISCQADQVAHLLLSGIKIGVSSRGLGSVTQRMGTLYVGDDFELVCWDIVSDPSTPGAFISQKQGDLQQYVEETKPDENKLPLFEKLNKYSEWLNG